MENENITGIFNGNFLFRNFVVARVDDLKKAGHPTFITDIEMVIDDLKIFGDEKGTVQYMISVLNGEKMVDLSVLKKTAQEFKWSVTWTYPTKISKNADFLGVSSCTRPNCPLVVITCKR
jgi:hypothetical protein